MQLISAYLRLGVTLSILWILSLLIIILVRSWWKPEACTTVESVSGFYEPGAYWSWILTTLSAMISTLSTERENMPSIDFIISALYVLASIGALQLQVCPSRV
jgi:hypothetical protein